MESAQQELDGAEISRIDMINNNTLRECAPECQGTYIECAKEVVQINNVPMAEFGDAVCDLLTFGRGNILICGPVNCGKTFLLKPLPTFSKHFATLPVIDLPGQHVHRAMLFS